MADPALMSIINAFTTAFQASTAGFATVTNKLEPWWDWQPSKFPGVCVISGSVEKTRGSFPHPTEGDMWGVAEINVRGYVFDISNDLLSKRENIRRDIEYTILNSTAINDVTADCIVQAEDDDAGQVENIGIVNSKCQVKYFYNHATL